MLFADPAIPRLVHHHGSAPKFLCLRQPGGALTSSLPTTLSTPFLLVLIALCSLLRCRSPVLINPRLILQVLPLQTTPSQARLESQLLLSAHSVLRSLFAARLLPSLTVAGNDRVSVGVLPTSYLHCLTVAHKPGLLPRRSSIFACVFIIVFSLESLNHLYHYLFCSVSHPSPSGPS